MSLPLEEILAWLDNYMAPDGTEQRLLQVTNLISPPGTPPPPQQNATTRKKIGVLIQENEDTIRTLRIQLGRRAPKPKPRPVENLDGKKEYKRRLLYWTLTEIERLKLTAERVEILNRTVIDRMIEH